MKFKTLKAIDYSKTIKCAIHQSGKLGFSQAAIDELNLNETKYLLLGINEDDKDDLNLYMQVLENKSEDTFKLKKAGNYYYLNTKRLFDELGFDYKKKSIIFDITQIIYDGGKLYKLIRRESDRKEKN